MKTVSFKSAQAPNGEGFLIHSITANTPLKNVTCIRSPEGLTLLIDTNNRIYSPNLRQVSYSSRSAVGARTMVLLAKLGVITEEQATAHAEGTKRQAARREATYALQQLQATAEEYGIKISKRELAKIEKVAA